jgi:hypothetical protein
LWVVIIRRDPGHGYRDFLLEPDRWLEQILREHARRGRFKARPELGKGVGYLIVWLEDMVELKTIELLLQLLNLLPVCSHARVVTVQLSHDLIDNKLIVSMDIKPLNPKFGSDA